uniref:Patatin-like phospholipase n=1 Tax=Pithovirus LCPAC401 TaxID=2506595 RepID=A0A481Z987_9VIRU|nr:MAG: patatin-like phospholipase [Pithovirus LCPAC401]
MVRYILSLDDGGVRGLATLHFLKELDIYLKERYDRCINDVFSLYIGTSVGGMIAACLACDKKPDELAKYVDENIGIVFLK